MPAIWVRVIGGDRLLQILQELAVGFVAAEQQIQPGLDGAGIRRRGRRAGGARCQQPCQERGPPPTLRAGVGAGGIL